MHAIHSIRLTGMLLALSVSVPLAPDPPVALAQEPLASTAPDRRPATIQRGGRLVQTTVLGTELAPDGRPMRAGGLIVKFRPDAAGPARESAHRGAGVLAIDTLGLPDTGRVQVRPGTTARAIAAYRSRPDVEFVEPHYVVRTTHTTNDPGFAVQWNMTKIGMPSAWDREQSGSSTRIAILDCGIYSSSSDGLASDNRPGHPDIRDKVVLERDFTASPTGADDLYHHGTHVAGVAAASTNNGLGVAGVGYNSGIMNGKVLGDDGAGSVSTVVGGIVWAADNGAKVINMSLGRDAPCVRSEADAVNYAWQRGVVIVAAAGNESTGSAGSPGNCPNVIAVGATDQSDRRASFSNYGAGVDVAAPGVSITSTNYTGNYEALDGTSMAAPHVAGLAALVWSSSYGTSNQAVANRLTSTSDRIAGTGSLWAHGRINAAAALGGSISTPAPTPTPAPTLTPAPVPTSTPVPFPAHP